MSSSTRRINTKLNMLVCAFCKHWYDPTFSHIRPLKIGIKMDWWEYDYDAKSLCKVWRKDKPAHNCCSKFERKDFK